MRNEDRDNLIKLIEEASTEKEFQKLFGEFIRTYDGTNDAELNFLVFGLTQLLFKLEELKLKEQGYDAFLANIEEFKTDVADIKKDYEELKSGKLPDDPAV
ncbi:MAG TPA: hypothetical protein VLI92_00050 [Candidatus Saccharimonadales bacterium]|nr:hypothetical protein [Candidatus Saccharimonadales bacterium]